MDPQKTLRAKLKLQAGARNGGSSAFSLGEVLLSIGLLAIALLALIGQSTILANANQKQDDNAVASDIAQARLETVARKAQIGDNNIYNWDSVNRYDSGLQTVGFTEYKWEVYISNVPGNVAGGVIGEGTGDTETRLKRVVAKVEWWEGRERPELGRLEVESSRLIKVTRDDDAAP